MTGMLEHCCDCPHVALMHTRSTTLGTYGCDQCRCLAFVRRGVVIVRDERWVAWTTEPNVVRVLGADEEAEALERFQPLP